MACALDGEGQWRSWERAVPGGWRALPRQIPRRSKPAGAHVTEIDTDTTLVRLIGLMASRCLKFMVRP